jgi:CRP-like cAMP-binding protein
MLANTFAAWGVPAILFVLVVAMGFAGVRWMGSQQVAGVRNVPLFSGLSSTQLRSVAEGDPGKSLFLIRRGTAAVSVAGAQTAVLESDGYFGEVSLLDGGPRTATVTAETQVSAFEITSASFDRLLQSDPSIARGIMDRMTTWLAESEEKVDRPGEGPADRAALAELGRRLRAARHLEWGEAASRRRRGPNRTNLARP